MSVKRKTYSIDGELALNLAHTALLLSDELGVNIPRQAILDELLVLLQGDNKVLPMVRKALKKKYKN